MKQVIWLLFIAAFLLSVSALFAQSNASAVSAQDEEAVQNIVKVQKVIDIRKVVVFGSATRSMTSKKVAGNVNQTEKTETSEKLQYDSKGGVIVPNASKGIKITPQNNQKAAKIKKAQKQNSDKAARLNKSTENQPKYRKDLNNRNAESSVKTKKQKDN